MSIVVDGKELDENGFPIATHAGDGSVTNDFAAQICSLEPRPASRDSEAIHSSNGMEKYDMKANPASGDERCENGFSLKLGFPDRRKRRDYSI